MSELEPQGKQVVGAIGLIKDDQSRIFMQQRNDPDVPEAHGKWEFPGGGIKFGDSPQETVRRECLEEMGCEVEVGALIPHVIANTWQQSNGATYQAFILTYLCKIVSGIPRPANEEVSAVGWFTVPEIKTMDILTGNLKLIELAERMV